MDGFSDWNICRPVLTQSKAIAIVRIFRVPEIARLKECL